MLCEIGWQHIMGGQWRCKHSTEKGNRTLHDEYKKGSSRAKKDRCVFIIEIVADCVEKGACKVSMVIV